MKIYHFLALDRPWQEIYREKISRATLGTCFSRPGPRWTKPFRFLPGSACNSSEGMVEPETAVVLNANGSQALRVLFQYTADLQSPPRDANLIARYAKGPPKSP